MTPRPAAVSPSSAAPTRSPRTEVWEHRAPGLVDVRIGESRWTEPGDALKRKRLRAEAAAKGRKETVELGVDDGEARRCDETARAERVAPRLTAPTVAARVRDRNA